MRRIVTAITAAAMALSLVSMATPANAVAGYDSAYAGESAFLTLNAGQSGTFTVFFQNTGTTSWAKGTASQVDLAACNEDKVTCNAQDASEAPFMSGWLSATRYATHTQTTVAPGSIGTFTYNVAAPAGQAAGTYRFNGALVLSSTGADIHNEGYYQDVTVPGAAAASCTPTAIALSPTFSQTQVGSTYTQTATVDCDAPTGSTTRPKASGAQVTFVADAPVGSLNGDLTLTATTDANGVASVTWTRSNPDTDSVAAFPTAQPAVRGTGTVRWTAAASGAVITCTPTDSASAVNGTTRTYTVTVKNPTTGAAATSLVVDVKFSASTTATVTTPTGSSAPSSTSGLSQEGTTDSAGVLAFTLTGSNTTASPIVFVDNDATTTWGGDADNNKDASEFNATCGSTTFAVQKAVIALTPDTASTVQNGGQSVYTVAATNTIGGGAFTGALRIGFTELTDSDLGTTTACTIAWVSNAATPASTPGTAGSGGRVAPSGTTNATLVPNTSGGLTFASTGTATACTPIVWHDVNADTAVQTEEPQDTGGKATFNTAGGGIASATLTSSATQPTSSGETTAADNGSSGEKTFTFTLKDAQGNTTNAPTGGVTVNFTVTNTGTRTINITAVNGTSVDSDTTTGGNQPIPVAAGAAQSISATIIAGASTASIEVDSSSTATDATNKNWASASIKGELASNTAVTKTSTITWVVADAETVVTTTAQGTVLAVDATNLWYLLDTPGGVFQIFWDNGDTFIVVGTGVPQATFESNISVGDVVKFTNVGNTDPAGTDTHDIQTNN